MINENWDAVAPLGFSIDGFEPFIERRKLPNFSVKTPNFYLVVLNFPKIDGFENPPLTIDGFGQTHRTHANHATVWDE